MGYIDKTYNNLLEIILKEGKNKGDRTNTGTLSIFGHQVRHKMQEGFPLLTTKKLHTKSIIHELLWFLQGNTNIKYLNDNGVTIWDEWVDSEGELGPVYGKQWVDWGGYYSTGHWNRDTNSLGMHLKGINQIQEIMNTLQTDPDSRRMVVSAWNVGEIPQMKLPPCHYGFQIYSRELSLKERMDYYLQLNRHPISEEDITHTKLNALRVPKRGISLMWNQRSVDTFLGLPFNISSYGLLLSMIAQQVNMLPLELIGNLGDCHIYKNHLSYVEEQLTIRDPNRESPKLQLNKKNNIFDYTIEDFQFINYKPQPNWKNVPIAV